MTIFKAFTARHFAVQVTRLSGMAVVAALAACAGQPKPMPDTAASTEQIAGKPVVNTTVDAVAGETQTAPTSHGSVDAEVTSAAEGETNITLRTQDAANKPAPPPPTPERVIIPDVTPHELMGMDPEMLEELLGRPELRRHEPPAEVWQYRAETCVFDLVLYSAPDNDNSSRVTFFEARDRDAQPANAANCLDSLLRQRAG